MVADPAVSFVPPPYPYDRLNALERLVAEKGIADATTLARYHDAWDHAADRTPHGAPIELRPEDFR